jgi:hypothetical protein
MIVAINMSIPPKMTLTENDSFIIVIPVIVAERGSTVAITLASTALTIVRPFK